MHRFYKVRNDRVCLVSLGPFEVGSFYHRWFSRASLVRNEDPVSVVSSYRNEARGLNISVLELLREQVKQCQFRLLVQENEIGQYFAFE